MKITLLDLKITLCCEFFFVRFPGVWILLADISVFTGLVYTTYDDGTECSETSVHKIQTPGNHPKERTQNHTCLKRKGSWTQLLYVTLYMLIKTWCWVSYGKLCLIVLSPFCKPRHSPIYFLILFLWAYSAYTPCDRRSQWPRGLRNRSAAARLLRLWVRLPPGAWMFLCFECC